MIRTMFVTTTAVLGLAASAMMASAAPMSPVPGSVTAGPSILLAGSGHSVCVKHQCPGRSRVVCGCANGAR